MDVLSEVLKVVKLQGAMYLQRRIFLAVECLLAALSRRCVLPRAGRRARDHLSLAHGRESLCTVAGRRAHQLSTPATS